MAKGQRNSHIELLRIAAMLMIVAHHYAAFGFFAEDLAFSRNKIFVDLFGMFGHVGVNLFVLITGYYSAGSHFRLKKIFMLMGSLWFYCVGMLCVFGLTALQPIDAEEIKGALFPLLTGRYWFASYYVLLLLLTPFLNLLINNLSRKGHAVLCLLFFILCTMLAKLLRVTFNYGMVPLFIALYLSGAWLRLYLPAGTPRARRRILAMLLLTLALCAVTVVTTDLRGQRDGDLKSLEESIGFMDVYSPPAFLLALLLLAAVCGREAASNRWVNLVGGLTFGVYLFHANHLLSAVVWQRAFHTSAFVDSPWLPLHAVGTVAVIFLVGCLIERLRQVSVGRLWERFVDALLRRLKMNDWIKGA